MNHATMPLAEIERILAKPQRPIWPLEVLEGLLRHPPDRMAVKAALVREAEK